MDYNVETTVFGMTISHGCATNTDVENTVINNIRNYRNEGAKEIKIKIICNF